MCIFSVLETKHTYYDTEFVSLSFENDIMLVTYKKGPITLEIAKDLVEKRLAFAKGKKYPYLILDQGKGIATAERDAREYIGNDKGKEGILCCAFYTESTFNKYMIQFITKVIRRDRDFPTKIFSKKQEALNWLASKRESLELKQEA